MKIVLFGTPTFAEHAFRPILQSRNYEIPLIVTQPDKPSGRGLNLTASPVKLLAEEFGIPLLQPVTLRGISRTTELLTTNPKNEDFCRAINSLGSIDLFLVVAYGKIIPKALLDTPRLGALNVHGSLLPRWRGAAPIQRAIAAGDNLTGVCLMALEEGLDTGPVYSSAQIEISPQENFGSVHDRLALLGSEILQRDLPKILAGDLTPIPQSTTGVTYAEKWEKSDLEICWNDPPETTFNRIRASCPAPGARTTLRGEQLKIFQSHLSEQVESQELPGMVVRIEEEYIVVALPGGRRLLLQELQLAGRRRLPAREIVTGRNIEVGDILGGERC